MPSPFVLQVNTLLRRSVATLAVALEGLGNIRASLQCTSVHKKLSESCITLALQNITKFVAYIRLFRWVHKPN